MIRTDEMAAVQALERDAPAYPCGHAARAAEFKYVRHGTLSYMINFDVARGDVICPTHCSESLAHDVAEVSAATDDLGIKENYGILKSTASRAPFLTDPWHKVVFHNKLRRGNFTSMEDLRTKTLDFIKDFNRMVAKPFNWTYLGKPLHA